jgi:hypothetical protein
LPVSGSVTRPLSKTPRRSVTSIVRWDSLSEGLKPIRCVRKLLSLGSMLI